MAKYERGVNLWISSLILIVLSILYIGKASMGSFLGLLLDKDGNTSASQLQQVLWTIVIISALIAAVSLNIAAKDQTNSLDPLKITISSDLWYLMGITSVSLAGSPMIKRDKSQARSLRRNRGYLFAIVYKDLDANSTQLDLGKVQMLYLTLIILLAYSLQIAALFSGKSITEFPQISPGMVTLLGISNAGYLAFKASQLN